MVKRSKQKPVTKMPMGWMLSFAILWPILVALSIHSHIFDNFITNLDVNSANIVTEIIALLPPAIVLFPFAYRLDSLYNSQNRPTAISSWQRAGISAVAMILALWILWYIYVFASIGLTV